MPRDPAALEMLLDDRERARAERFYAVRARELFVLGRAAARTVLGRALDRDPRELRFVRRCAACGASDHGKPYLAEHAGEVDFSISHSGDRVLVAVGCARAVGVDIERIRESSHVDVVARHALSEPDREVLAGLYGGERHRAFFRCWTRKEAYLKARAIGMAGGLDRWTVAPDGSVSATSGADRAEAAHWRVQTLDMGSVYLAAVASEGPFDVRLEQLDIARG
jgi:4'-phosphopantetheinyl transferase